jgi:predicted dehydrogenase
MHPSTSALSRRDFVKLSAATTTAAVLASLGANRVLAASAGRERLRVGVIGCGGRGTGAAQNCRDADPAVEIVALADLFPAQVAAAQKKLNVPQAATFSGFDAYQKLLALSDLDIVILAAPPGFRPTHFEAAVNAGKHIFCEKPIAVDPTGVRQFIAAAQKAKEKKIGTQRRHHPGYIEVMKRVHGGEIGELVGGQCYWNGTEPWYRARDEKDKDGNIRWPWLADLSDFEWQCFNWYHWDWLCGDHIVEQHIHNIDVVNWAFGGPPAKFMGVGGRQTRGNKPGNIWDCFAVEMEYPNGARVMSMCRHAPKATNRVAERIVGTKGVLDTRENEQTLKTATAYKYEGPVVNPMVQEHKDLIASIRSGELLNEGERVALSTLTAIGGRMSAYTGREISWKWLLEGSKLDIFPKETKPGAGIFGAVPVPGTVELV